MLRSEIKFLILGIAVLTALLVNYSKKTIDSTSALRYIDPTFPVIIQSSPIEVLLDNSRNHLSPYLDYTCPALDSLEKYPKLVDVREIPAGLDKRIFTALSDSDPEIIAEAWKLDFFQCLFKCQGSGALIERYGIDPSRGIGIGIDFNGNRSLGKKVVLVIPVVNYDQCLDSFKVDRSNPFPLDDWKAPGVRSANGYITQDENQLMIISNDSLTLVNALKNSSFYVDYYRNNDMVTRSIYDLSGAKSWIYYKLSTVFFNEFNLPVSDHLSGGIKISPEIMTAFAKFRLIPNNIKFLNLFNQETFNKNIDRKLYNSGFSFHLRDQHIPYYLNLLEKADSSLLEEIVQTPYGSIINDIASFYQMQLFSLAITGRRDIIPEFVLSLNIPEEEAVKLIGNIQQRLKTTRDSIIFVNAVKMFEPEYSPTARRSLAEEPVLSRISKDSLPGIDLGLYRWKQDTEGNYFIDARYTDGFFADKAYQFKIGNRQFQYLEPQVNNDDFKFGVDNNNAGSSIKKRLKSNEFRVCATYENGVLLIGLDSLAFVNFYSEASTFESLNKDYYYLKNSTDSQPAKFEIYISPQWILSEKTDAFFGNAYSNEDLKNFGHIKSILFSLSPVDSEINLSLDVYIE